MPLRLKIGGAYCFCPVCHSVNFLMNIPCDKTFLWVPLFLTLWHWPWNLTHFLKTWTLLITFEQWVLELWYFTWVFLVIWPFRGYHYFLINIRAFILHMSISCYKICPWYQDICPCDLDHLWNWPLSGAFVFHKHILFLLKMF